MASTPATLPLSAPSTPGLATPRRPRDLSHNPILTLGGPSLSRPSSANRLRPPSPSAASAREREHALIRPPPSTGEVRALEQSVGFSLESLADTLRAHADALRALESKARAGAAIESRVFSMHAELLLKADGAALERLAAGTDELVQRARDELREGAALALRHLERELRPELAALSGRAAAAEEGLAAAAARLAAAAEERGAMGAALARLEARADASDAAAAALRADVERLRAGKAERAEVAAAVAASAAAVTEELESGFERELAARADSKAEASELREAAGRLGAAEKHLADLGAALNAARAGARAAVEEAEGRWRARSDSVETSLAELARQEAARAERADALERRLAMRTDAELRKLREDLGGARAEAADALAAVAAEWERALEWRSAQARAELDERTGALEREAATLAPRAQLGALERALRAELGAKADAGPTAEALRKCARDTELREQGALLAEVAGLARGAESWLGRLERELGTKCGPEHAREVRAESAKLRAALTAAELAAAAADARVSEQVRQLSELQLSELSLCRFVWDGGRAAGPEQLVLWDAQPTNRAPANISWAEGTAEISMAAAGLYEFKFGLFAPASVGAFRARLQLNGETVAEACGPPAGLAAPPGARGLDAAARRLAGGAGDGPQARRPSPAGARPASARRRGRQGTPRRRPVSPPVGLPPWPAEPEEAHDGPRICGPSCAVLVCALPSSRLTLALGSGVPARALNGFLEVRKVFN